MVPVTVAPLCAKNKKRGAKMGCTKIVFVITLVQIAAKQSSKTLLFHGCEPEEGYPTNQ